MNDYELNELLRGDNPPLVDLKAADDELRELYEEQQRRLCCPSCGDEPFID